MQISSPVLRSLLIAFTSLGTLPLLAEESNSTPTLRVPACEDFEITGLGDAGAWKKAEWTALNRRSPSARDYTARFKMLYSAKGLYVLFDGTDKKLTATMTADYDELWKEDVFECFFWPDEKHPVYFEYEISPLGYELPILVPNLDKKFRGWRPWQYEGDRKIKKVVHIGDGDQKPGAAISNWTAEVFIPYELLTPLSNVPPKAGTKWRANFYRCDYDGGKQSSWDWARVGPSFHEYEKFGVLVFE
jgi:hypothetical protein